jgi:hypothetical protein
VRISEKYKGVFMLYSIIKLCKELGKVVNSYVVYPISDKLIDFNINSQLQSSKII